LQIESQSVILTFCESIRTGSALWSNRETILLRVSGNDGQFGTGESAPLPAWGTETFPVLFESLDALNQQILNTEIPRDSSSLETFLAQFDSAFNTCPALRFGIESALLDAIGKRLQKPVYTLLSDTPHFDILESFLLAFETDTHFYQTALAAYRNGYRTYKVKSSGNYELDKQRLFTLRTHLENVSLRYDVNGTWSVEETLIRMRELDSLHLEYIEQPVITELTEKLMLLADKLDTPIALDESVCTFSLAKQWLNRVTNMYFIIKPMAIGGFQRTIELSKLADETHNHLILSSAFDSGVAASAYRHLAAAIGSYLAHGIGTNRLLIEDTVIENPIIESGITKIDSNSFGLGISLSSHFDKLWSKELPHVSA